MDNIANKKKLIRTIRMRDIWIYSLIMLISIMILLRDVQGISINKYIFIALATFAFCIGNKSDIYCILSFITPLCSGISYTYISLIALIVLSIKKTEKKFNKIGIFCLASICILELISISQGNFSFGVFFRFFGVLIIAFGRMIDANEKYDNNSILRFFIIGMIVALLSIWGQMLQAYSFKDILSLGNVDLRFGNTKKILNIAEDGMRVYYNPNGLGYLCCISALISLLLLKKNKNKLYYVFFFLFSLQGIMTGSRAFIIIFPIGLISFLILQNRKKHVDIRTILVLIVSSSLLIYLSKNFISSYVDAIIRRFKVSDISNGRNSLLTYYFDQWVQSVWRITFGSGLQSYQEKYGAPNTSHNSIQEILITWGAVGLIVVIILLITIIKQVRRKNPYVKPFQYVPFLSYLLLTLSGQGFSDAAGLLRLMVTYSALLINFDNNCQPIAESKTVIKRDI